MGHLYMISFIYKNFTYYANVIEYDQSPLSFYISILASRDDMPRKLIFIEKDGALQLSVYSIPAPKELVNCIVEKIMNHKKSEVA